MPIRRKVPVRPQPKPPGTRCYVPGFMNDAEQFAIDQSQLGVAPVVVGAAAKLATGGRVLGVSFKKPSPRVFGGPLYSTLNNFKDRIERGDVGGIDALWKEATTAKDKSAWRRIWNELLPTWRITPAQYERIKQLDPSLQVMMPTAAPAPYVPPYVAPGAPPPSGVTPPSVPSVGPTTIYLPPSGGSGGPVLMPQPPSMLPGGEPLVPDEVARPVVAQAGLFGGDMGKLVIPGLILFAITQLGGKKRR